MTRRIRGAALVLATLATVFATAVAGESAREVVYNRVSRRTTDLDRLVTDVYGPKYDVRLIQEDDPDYLPPRVSSGRLPSVVLDDKGAPIRGYALVLYVVKSDGAAADPVVVKSTDPRIDGPAKAALLRARFTAATWKGKSISTIAGQEFAYDRP